MRGTWPAVLLVVPVALAVAAPAPAAVTLGDISGGGNQSCSVANSPNLNTSAPYVVPSAGVITSWSNKARSGSGQQLRFKVYRGNPAPPTFLTVGESPLTDIVASTENTFNVRIPVAAGDFIGLTTGPNSATAAPDCFFQTGNAGDTYFERGQESPLGSSAMFNAVPGNRVNVAARLEPDRDCDGLGDESQDTSVQTCAGGAKDSTKPRLRKTKARASARRTSVSVTITPNEACTLRAGATVALGKVAAKSSIRLASVKKAAKAGKATKLTLKVRRKDRARLRRALRRSSRKAKLTVSATDAAGNTSRTSSSVKLKRL
jgi:hypothetical protein